MRQPALLLAALVGALAAPVMAQSPPQNIRGVVQSVDGDTLRVSTREGKVVSISLAKGWSVVMMKPVAMDAITPGSFIGTTEIERPGGGGTSLEVHVFPPGQKIGEGHYPWDLKPGTNMTNGTVTHMVVASSGRELDVTYPTGTRHVVVPPSVPVVEIVPGERAMLKPGAGVFIPPFKTPDGGLGALRVLVGANGQAPAM
jgi:hypothetical protein